MCASVFSPQNKKEAIHWQHFEHQSKIRLKTKQIDFYFEADDVSLPVQEASSVQNIWSCVDFQDLQICLRGLVSSQIHLYINLKLLTPHMDSH